MPFDASSLATISELAMTLFGVTGIVAVFLGRSELGTKDRARFLMIVLPTLLVALAGYVPIWLSRYSEDPLDIWRLSTLIVLVTMFATTLAMNVLGYGLRSAVFYDLKRITPPTMMVIYVMIAALNLLLLFANSTGWPFPPNQTMYEVVLFLLLLKASGEFVSLVLYRSDGGT
jgi:hypothetical protein